MRRKKSFTLTAQSLLQNRFQLQFWFHFLEDQGELMYKTQYEMDWGTEEDNILLPNSLRVSTWILTKPVLETDHQFSKTVPPGQPASIVRLWLMQILRELSPHCSLHHSQLCQDPFSHLKWICFILQSARRMSNSHSQAEALTEVLVLTFIFLSMTEIRICPPHSPVTQWEMVEFFLPLAPFTF